MTEQAEAQTAAIAAMAAKLDANPDLLQEAREAVCAVMVDELWDEMESGGKWYKMIMGGLRGVSSYTTKELANEIAYHMDGEETPLEEWIANAKALIR